ncbi:MAG: DeoR/GlpR transcriptional regulator [Clostridiales bacterium]|nr:DeoR/GlpR transcriptional regulator [Clostridiales bacterium]
MLLEKRLEQILKLVEQNGSVSVQELTELLGASESTIRRDLTLLSEEGRVNKVHGGATAINFYYDKDEDVESRKNLNKEEKIEIAKYAASLIQPNDLVYLDAGTTTERVIDFITERNAVYVTNAISHAKKLVEAGCEAHILGGRFKLATEAIVGNETIADLERYNFTIGFIGTNGVSRQSGFSTPDITEAMVKRKAIMQCRRPYILCDAEKFNQISPITFAAFEDATILTTEVRGSAFKGAKNIIEINKKGKERR